MQKPPLGAQRKPNPIQTIIPAEMFIPATPTSIESENGTPNGVNN